MPGLIQGLEIARRALLAQQSSLNITGHNIANVATEGYTRRTPILVPMPPEETPQGIIGTGVRLEGVRRNRSFFLDAQLRKEASLSGRWESRSQVLQQIESLVAEPSDGGLGAAFDDFFNSWLELSNQPEDAGTRAVVVQAGQSLARGLQDQDARFEQLLESTDVEVEQRVLEINQSLDEIGRLYVSIQQSEISGTLDADLRDRRDVLLDQLAEDVGAEHLIRADGSVVVRIGPRTVVEGTDVVHLESRPYTVDQRRRVRLVFSSDGRQVEDVGGRLGGLIEVREEIVPDLRSKYDTLAKDLANAVNQIHRAGPSGTPFFSGDSAATLSVDSAVANDVSLVNAGSSGDPGDNDIALALAGLRDARILQRGTATLSDSYRQIVSQVGSLSAQAGTVSGAQQTAYDALKNQRQSVQGVNLDEELTQLVETQKAYEAAAKIFTASADMIDVILRM
ncbi:MAG: flagellar hook-associated protein FlgK [Candidatus Eisenbacteria bacterium]